MHKDSERGWRFFLVADNSYGLPRTVKIESRDKRIVSNMDDFKWRVLGPGKSVKWFDLTGLPRRYQAAGRFSVVWVVGDAKASHDDGYVYRMPFPGDQILPIAQGYHGAFSHIGNRAYAIDFEMPMNTPVCAARAGIVGDLRDGNESGGEDRIWAKHENKIAILHDDGTIGQYGHLQKDFLVSVGQRVERGRLIAYSGSSGFSTGPHLHFEVWSAVNYSDQKSIPVTFSRFKNRSVPYLVGDGEMSEFSDSYKENYGYDCLENEA